MPCPYSSIANHSELEQPEDEREDEDPTQTGEPRGVPALPLLPSRNISAGRPRGRGTAAGVPGQWQIPLPPYNWPEEVLGSPEPVPLPEPVPGLPKPVPVPAIAPRPVGIQEPVRNPFANPEVQRALSARRAQAAADATARTAGAVARRWKPSEAQVRQFSLPTGRVPVAEGNRQLARARLAISETAVSDTAARSESSQRGRTGNIPRWVGPAIAGGAATGAAVLASRGRGGGGGGFSFNAAARLRTLIGATSVRKFRQSDPSL